MRTVQGQGTVAGSPVPGTGHSTPEPIAAKASPGPAAACMSRPDSRSPGLPGVRTFSACTGTPYPVQRVSHSVWNQAAQCPAPHREESKDQGRARVSVIVQGPAAAVMQTSSDRACVPPSGSTGRPQLPGDLTTYPTPQACQQSTKPWLSMTQWQWI